MTVFKSVQQKSVVNVIVFGNVKVILKVFVFMNSTNRSAQKKLTEADFSVGLCYYKAFKSYNFVNQFQSQKLLLFVQYNDS